MAGIWGYDVDQLLEMDRSELGLVILRQFREGQEFHAHNVTLGAKNLAERADVPFGHRRDLEDAVASACKWLDNEGYVVAMAGGSSGWQRVSKRGAAAAAGAPAPARKVTLLSSFAIDSRLDDAVANFERGLLDAAVTLAMKAVEIAVRTAVGGKPTDFGDALMKKAFMAPGGVLEDPRLPAAENVGRSALYSGAVGWLRNPAGHRRLAVDQQEAAEIILLANYLIRVVDQAALDRAAGWPAT